MGGAGLRKLLARRRHTRTDLADKKYWRILGLAFLGIFVLQMIVIYCIYFYTSWDVRVVMNAADTVKYQGFLGINDYFTYYPNNLMLLAIIVLARAVPILGNHHIFLLSINALFVLTAGILACLTVRNMTRSNRRSLWALALLAPLMLLSPWIVIPYTDTFAAPFPIAMVYLYTLENKKWWHYLIMGLVAVIGYYIKPTTVIVTIAIIIVEIVRIIDGWSGWKKYKLKINRNSKLVMATLLGCMLGIIIGKTTPEIAKFSKDYSLGTITMAHYLAMGQNDETLGAWSNDDVADSLQYGQLYDLKKFWQRLTARDLAGNAAFFTKKLAYNYNDGGMSWGMDGDNFYVQLIERSDALSQFLREVYYTTGKYHVWYRQALQCIWIFTLLLCLASAIRAKQQTWAVMVIELAILGLTMFLMIFEPKARYLYCFLPIFILRASITWCNLGRNNTAKFQRSIRRE